MHKVNTPHPAAYKYSESKYIRIKEEGLPTVVRRGYGRWTHREFRFQAGWLAQDLRCTEAMEERERERETSIKQRKIGKLKH